MNRLDDMSPAAIPPFFYTRLRQRLAHRKESFWTKVTELIANPVIAVTTIALVFSLDAALLFNAPETPVTTSENSISAQYLELYSADEEFYGLSYDDITVRTP